MIAHYLCPNGHETVVSPIGCKEPLAVECGECSGGVIVTARLIGAEDDAATLHKERVAGPADAEGLAEEYWHGRKHLGLIEWINERIENCKRIAAGKAHEDKERWLEDAWYFEQIAAALHKEGPAGEPPAILKRVKLYLDSWEERPAKELGEQATAYVHGLLRELYEAAASPAGRAEPVSGSTGAAKNSDAK